MSIPRARNRLGISWGSTLKVTVIFKDFKAENVFQISIPFESVERLKEKLNLVGVVKYYENKQDLDWKSIVKNITDDPATFVRNDGCGFYGSQYLIPDGPDYFSGEEE